MLAYLDESLRQSEAGICVAAAAVVGVETVAGVRQRLRDLLLPRQTRLHWRDDSEAQHGRVVTTITDLQPTALVYVVRPVGRRQQERSRAIALTRLLWDLIEADVTHLTFEARTHALNQRDAATILHARQAGHVPPGLTWDFQRPRAEPLLWVPDAIASAVAAHTAGEESHHYEALGEVVRLVELAP